MTGTTTGERGPAQVMPLAGTEILRVLAYCTIGAITMTVLVDAALAGTNLAYYAALDDVVNGGSDAGFVRASLVSTAVYALDVLALVVSAALFIAWTYRARRNLEAAGVTGFTHERGWVIGAWFIPFVNLVMPYRVVSEIAYGSDPQRPWWQAPSGSQRRDLLISCWWGAWVGGSVVSGVAARAASRSEDHTAEELLADQSITYVLSALALTTNLVAGILAAAVVLRVTRNQHWQALSPAVSQA